MQPKRGKIQTKAQNDLGNPRAGNDPENSTVGRQPSGIDPEGDSRVDTRTRRLEKNGVQWPSTQVSRRQHRSTLLFFSSQ